MVRWTSLTNADNEATYLSGLEPFIRASVTDMVGDVAETITRINITIDDPDDLLSTAYHYVHYSALYR